MQMHAIDGELTIFTAAEMKSTLLAFLNTNDDIEINLANVTEIDAAGLQLLILLKRESAKAGKTLHYVMHSRIVLELMELANLTSSFGDQIVLAHNEG
jgi:anti-sigma B factor antagonist